MKQEDILPLLKDEKSLLDSIQTAVAGYCYDFSDKNFNIVISVSASDGWVKAEINKE